MRLTARFAANKLTMQPEISHSKFFKMSSLWICLGAFFLLLELVLIQAKVVTLELADHKTDKFSLALAAVTWTCLAVGLVCLSRSRPLSGKRRSTYPALSGLIVYTLGCIVVFLEQWSLVYLVPVGLLLTACGMIFLGVSALRQKMFTPALGWAILITGIFPFVFMFPIVAIQGSPNYSVNYSWGFSWAFLGITLMRQRLGKMSPDLRQARRTDH